jgi:predicted SAM-dependent methyltransferase
MDVPELREHYPELANLDLVSVDVVDDGETLALQPDEALDFVIANHFVEHTQDPLGMLRAHLRVLRPGGILYLAVPDRRKTFDADRAPTPIEHVVRDHREGPDWSRDLHREEWARLVEKVPDEQVAEHVQMLRDTDYSIHFHVWSPVEFTELLEHARSEEGLPFSIELLQSNQDEFISILRKTSN